MGYLDVISEEDSRAVIRPAEMGFTSAFGAYPNYRDVSKGMLVWGRSQFDGAQCCYWRVHDQLYDLTELAATHPGGSWFIQATRGLDVTELFESSHLSAVPEQMLKKYWVGDAVEPRNSQYTFHDDGFYRTLKRRVAKKLLAPGSGGTGPSWKTHAVMDGIVAASLVTGWLAAAWKSTGMAVLAGFVLHMVPNVAHNYIHQRPTWRMYYVGLTQALAVNGFRALHVITHHVYPNTVYDADIFSAEPFIHALTRPKAWTHRWLSPVLLVSFMLFGGTFQAFSNLYYYLVSGQLLNSLECLATLAWWPLYWLASGGCVATACWTWLVVAHVSFAVGLFGLFAGTHRHPDDFHDGDTPRAGADCRDWGLLQLDTTNERREFENSVVLSGLLFGDHALHHLFPTVDCSRLYQLYPILFDVCRQFDVQLRVYSQWEVTRAMFTQLMRTEASPVGPERHRYTGPSLEV